MSNQDDLFIRLYIDEDVHGNVSKALRQQGYNVISVNEVKQGGISDRQQLAFATEQKRAIFTFNAADFISLHLEYIEKQFIHSGIIVSKQISLEETISRLMYLLDRFSADEIHNQLLWLPLVN